MEVLRFVVALTVTCCVLLRSSSQAARDPPSYQSLCDVEAAEKANGGQWHFVLNENFDGNKLNKSLWRARYTDEVGHENEEQYYVPWNAEVRDGMLLLHSRREAYRNKNYTSAWVDSSSAFGVRYGRVCIRANIPSKQIGFWPALWLMPLYEVCWPGAGEVDILEMLNGDGVVRGTYHFSPFYYNSECNVSAEASSSVWIFSNSSFGDSFHEFAVDWTDQYVSFFVDGKPFLTVYVSDTKSDGVPQSPMFMIMNSALGGWSGAVSDQTRFPITFSIDYIRVIQKMKQDADGHVMVEPPRPAVGAASDADDTSFNPAILAILKERSRLRRRP